MRHEKKQKHGLFDLFKKHRCFHIACLPPLIDIANLVVTLRAVYISKWVIMKLKRPSSAPAHREQKHQLITTLNLDLRGPSPSSARNQLDPISNSDHFPSRQPPFPVVSGRHKSVKMDHRSVSNGKLLLGASSSILRCDGPDVTKEKSVWTNYANLVLDRVLTLQFPGEMRFRHPQEVPWIVGKHLSVIAFVWFWRKFGWFS